MHGKVINSFKPSAFLSREITRHKPLAFAALFPPRMPPACRLTTLLAQSSHLSHAVLSFLNVKVPEQPIAT